MLKKIETKRCRCGLVILMMGFIGLSSAFTGIPAYAKAEKTLIDLNTASEKDLESIKGIGPATAKRIIAGRPYESVEDLKKAGIPQKTIESLKPQVTVGTAPASGKTLSEGKPTETTGATKMPQKTTTQAPAKLAPGQKVNINSATKEQLESLPGVGAVKAQAIIDGRPFKNIEDVTKVKGIKEGTFNKIKDLITVQ